MEYFCLITVVEGKQEHAHCGVLLSYNCGWG